MQLTKIKYLIWDSQLKRIGFHDHHGKEDGSRQTVVESSHLDPQAQGRKRTNCKWYGFLKPQNLPSDTPVSNKITSPNPFQFYQVGTKHPNTWTKLGLGRGVLIQTSTVGIGGDLMAKLYRYSIVAGRWPAPVSRSCHCCWQCYYLHGFLCKGLWPGPMLSA